MGQAKDRGPFEKRKAESIVRKAKEAEEYEQQMAEYEANLPPEQKRKRQEAQNVLATFLGFTIASLTQPKTFPFKE
jgi:hypothetical protein